MKSISLVQLQYILSVARHRNFSSAAEACRVTQPTLSMQIQKLEQELGVILFDRTRQPVQPTSIGLKVIDQARKALYEVAGIEEILEEEKGLLRGTFRLGVIPTLAPYLLPLFLEKFLKTYPEVDLIVDELQTGHIIEHLKDDRLDAGLLVTPLQTTGILERPLFYEPFVVYLTPRHRLSKKKQVSQNDLSLEDIWLLNEGHCFRGQALDLCKQTKGAITGYHNLVLQSGNLETLKRLVDRNLGYTLLPLLAAEQVPRPDARLRHFRNPVPVREVSLAYNRSFLKQGILDALFSTIQSSVPKSLITPPASSRVVPLQDA